APRPSRGTAAPPPAAPPSARVPVAGPADWPGWRSPRSARRRPAPSLLLAASVRRAPLPSPPGGCRAPWRRPWSAVPCAARPGGRAGPWRPGVRPGADAAPRGRRRGRAHRYRRGARLRGPVRPGPPGRWCRARRALPRRGSPRVRRSCAVAAPGRASGSSLASAVGGLRGGVLAAGGLLLAGAVEPLRLGQLRQALLGVAGGAVGARPAPGLLDQREHGEQRSVGLLEPIGGREPVEGAVSPHGAQDAGGRVVSGGGGRDHGGQIGVGELGEQM